MIDVDGVTVAWSPVVRAKSGLHAEFVLTCGPVQSLGWASMPLADGDSAVTVELPSGTTVNAGVEKMIIEGFRKAMREYRIRVLAARGAVAT